jgi:membrane-associated protease RseP (regulator of RpoE activity)
MSSDTPTATPDSPAAQKRRVALPVVLFLATCLSTFWVGTVDWKPIIHLDALIQAIHPLRGLHVFTENLPQGSPAAALRQAFSVSQLGTAFGVAQMDWWQGLIYMSAVLGILLTHEMGHFLMALRHRIPASLPYFIPVPVIPFGTMGAVISMEGSKANRREMFDLGAAGPLAGLVVALPITWVGIRMLPAVPLQGDSFCFHNPLLFQYLIAWLRPDYPTPAVLYLNQFNPFLMAGWMGMLVTGLNMLPISQLDGGHVAYAVLGQRGAHIVARGFLITAILFILVMEKYLWVVMLVLVILLGTDHPPTADDDCRMGRVRTVIGWLALLVPILCLSPLGITPVGK